MKITTIARSLEIKKEVDVLVVGGGPAGIGAAISAARQNRKVMLLEKRGYLGGNITGSYVETCNHFLHGSSFQISGIYAEMEEKYKAQYQRSHDVRINSPHRFSSEYLKVFLDEFMLENGVEVKFHSFVNEVVVENNRIQAVIIQSKQGPIAVKAGIIIDATGDGDVAFSAGVPFEQGRDKDGLCQPGTVNFRIAGVDVSKLTEGEDKLKVIGRKFKEDYRAGRTGLHCKRQDLPFGRLTEGGQVSYVNYPCAYFLDPTNIDDLTKGEMECRQYIMELYDYMKKNFEGFENAEISSIAPEIGFRDSRRIKGLYRLTVDDMEMQKEFDDVIAVYPRFYDMLAPDANMDGDGSFKGGGYAGHIYEPIVDERTYNIPYRCLLPVGIDNLVMAGRCISTDHVAESSIRGISACMITGQAAGAAAAIADRDKVLPKDINIKELQAILKKQGIKLPEKD